MSSRIWQGKSLFIFDMMSVFHGDVEGESCFGWHALTPCRYAVTFLSIDSGSLLTMIVLPGSDSAQGEA